MQKLDELAKQKVAEITETINEEVKVQSQIRGKKIKKSVLQNFFKNASQFKTLGDVKQALTKLYKTQNVKITPEKLSSIINAYAKRVKMSIDRKNNVQESVEEFDAPTLDIYLNEESLSNEEKKKKEKYVKAMKKNYKQFVKKYGDNALSVIHAVATNQAKKD